MTPFQQFRLWARRAPILERVSTAVVGVVLLGVLGWAVMPLATNGSTTEAGDSSTNLTFAELTGGSAAPASVPPPDNSGKPCDPAPSSAQGVTDDSVDVAVALVDLGGAAGNNTFGLASVEDQKAAYTAVGDSINASGGAGCRQLALHFYNANGGSADMLHQTCLSILQDKPFVVLDVGGFQPETACITDAKVPFFTARVSMVDADKKYPYMFGRQADELALRNTVFALKELKYFEGDQKVGVVYRDCVPTTVDSFFSSLAEVGYPDDKVVKYNVGCTAGFTPPEATQQAVLKFKKAGVTRLIPMEMAVDFASFTRTAQAQQFKPEYGVSGYDGILDVTYGLLGPDFDNLEGSIAIAASGFGEDKSDIKPDVGTKACDELMTGAGLEPVYQQLAGLGGLACSQLWQLQAILDNVTEVSAAALPEGMSKAGPLPYSFPVGPTSNTDPRITFGGQYWRPLEFRGDCDCWQLTDNTFKPGFP